MQRAVQYQYFYRYLVVFYIALGHVNLIRNYYYYYYH